MKDRKISYIVLIICLFAVSGCGLSTTHYKEIEVSKLSENIQKSFTLKNKEKKYPQYYGGSYISNNHLIVLVLGDTSKVRKDLVKRCQGNNLALFSCQKQSDVTKKILHELSNFRNDERNSQLMKELQLKSCYLNSNQRVSIELLSFQEDIFREKVIDSPFLDFEKTIIELQ